MQRRNEERDDLRSALDAANRRADSAEAALAELRGLFEFTVDTYNNQLVDAHRAYDAQTSALATERARADAAEAALAEAIEAENAATNARDLSAASCRVERALDAYRALGDSGREVGGR